MRSYFVASFLAVYAASSANAADYSSSKPLDCSTPLKIGPETYDFSSLPSTSLHSSTLTPPSNTIFDLQASLCSPIPDLPSNPTADSCPAGTRICLKTSIERSDSGQSILAHVIPLTTESNGFEVDLGDREGTGSVRNLDFTFFGPAYGGQNQKVKVELVCDTSTAGGPGSIPQWQGFDLSEGKAKVKWRTEKACPRSMTGGSTIPGNSKGGWGFFGWFFFLMIIGFIAYFAIGTYMNQQQYGVAEIPHRDFWREAPYLVQDAARHAWRSVSGGGGGSSRGSYEPL